MVLRWLLDVVQGTGFTTRRSFHVMLTYKIRFLSRQLNSPFEGESIKEAIWEGSLLKGSVSLHSQYAKKEATFFIYF